MQSPNEILVPSFGSLRSILFATIPKQESSSAGFATPSASPLLAFAVSRRYRAKEQRSQDHLHAFSLSKEQSHDKTAYDSFVASRSNTALVTFGPDFRVKKANIQFRSVHHNDVGRSLCHFQHTTATKSTTEVTRKRRGKLRIITKTTMQ